MNFENAFIVPIRKMLPLIYFFILALGISSCSREVETVMDKEIVVNNRSINEVGVIDNLVDTIEVIPLETSPNSLVPDYPGAILFNGGRIFIANQTDGKLTIFNSRNGQFIKQLSPSGEGPGEYSFLSSITFNPFTEELELHAGFQRKDLIFDKNGNFLREEAQDLIYTSKQYLSKDIAVFHCYVENSEFLGQDRSYKIVWYDKSKNEWKYFYPVSEKESKLSGYLMVPSHFHMLGNELIWFEPFNKSIKTINRGGVEDRYNIKFTANPMPEGFWENNHKYTMMTEAVQKEGFPFISPFFFENENLIVFSYRYERTMPLVFYSKKERKVVLNISWPIVEKWKLNLPPSPKGIDKDGLLYLVASSDFKSHIKHHPESNDLPQPLLAANKNLKEGDNPVLIKLVLK